MIKFPMDAKEFFDKCVKHQSIPSNDFLKQIILLRLLEDFEDERIYSEIEVNAIIRKYFEEYVWLRRELINFGYVRRDPVKATYWVVKRTLTKSDVEKNTMLKRHAQPYGVLDEQ